MIRIVRSAVVTSSFFVFSAFAQEGVGMKLEDAGFKMNEARTEKQMMRLRSIPPRQFVRRTRNGVPYYIYADPDFCKCAYIGGQKAMTDYRLVITPGTGLPGYDPNADMTRPSGDNLTQDMFTDMGEDGDMPGQDDDMRSEEDDIFDPGLGITIPLMKTQ